MWRKEKYKNVRGESRACIVWVDDAAPALAEVPITISAPALAKKKNIGKK